MFGNISEERFQRLAGDFIDARCKLNNLYNKTTELPSTVRALRSDFIEYREIVRNQKQIINNLTQVIKTLVSNKDLKKVIGKVSGVDVTIGDVLNSDNLMPTLIDKDKPKRDTNANDESITSEEMQSEYY